MRAGSFRINGPASNERRQLEYQHQNAEWRAERAGEVERSRTYAPSSRVPWGRLTRS
jgi:hypothetical protein